jgi:hypothetical protein
MFTVRLIVRLHCVTLTAKLPSLMVSRGPPQSADRLGAETKRSTPAWATFSAPAGRDLGDCRGLYGEDVFPYGPFYNPKESSLFPTGREDITENHHS